MLLSKNLAIEKQPRIRQQGVEVIVVLLSTVILVSGGCSENGSFNGLERTALIGKESIQC